MARRAAGEKRPAPKRPGEATKRRGRRRMEWRTHDAARRGAHATIASRWPVRPLDNRRTNANLAAMTVDRPPLRCTELRTLATVFIANTLIATVLWLAGVDPSYTSLWLLSQCIGLSIQLAHLGLQQLGARDSGSRWQAALSIAVGATLGIALAQHLGFFSGLTVERDWHILLRVGAMAVIIGAVAHAFFHNAQRVAELKIEQQAAQLRELERQKGAATANLKLLQAQIEPHFLFNTLANLHSLIGTNDALARRLLERLNDYLRASLDHSRSASGTLGDECRLLAAYLDIQALRMGGRLAWQIDVPPELAEQALPPMLLQPLVENAIRHGIEPRVGAGHVTLSARTDGRRRCLAVSDDGRGLTAAQEARPGRSRGVGLDNVRERLVAIYGDDAELVLRENQPTGVTAELWIPFPDPAH